MSPEAQVRGGKVVPSNNLYTAIMALSLFTVLATAAFVAYKCYFEYETFFKLP